MLNNQWQFFLVYECHFDCSFPQMLNVYHMIVVDGIWLRSVHTSSNFYAKNWTTTMVPLQLFSKHSVVTGTAALDFITIPSIEQD